MRGFERNSKLWVLKRLTGLDIEIGIYGFSLMGISGSATNGFSL
jgi:hypothetical protein